MRVLSMSAVEPAAPAVGVQLLRDYVELCKPRIASMALVTVAAGYCLGATPGAFHWDHFLHVLFGAGLVAAGGSALNHLFERLADARMHRTQQRPIPIGRVTPQAALVFGCVTAIFGCVYLLKTLPTPAAALAALLTFLLYVAVYTPLKRVTTWNTVIGAVPGALPPVIGWCAAHQDVTPTAWSLFAILFVWQLPHFYSIAWLHREDYARGGMKMLPVLDHEDGRLTGWATATTCLVLVGVTAAPYAVGTTGLLYLIPALVLALWFQARCFRFARERSNSGAKSVLRGSLVYLVGVMALLVIDGILPRYF